MTLATSSSIHINIASMTQRTHIKHLSLPSTVQHTQPLSHAFYGNARTRRFWRHKPLFPWRHSTCSKATGVECYGAISSWCLIGWASEAYSDYRRNGDYECYKDKWLIECANWRPNEVLSLSSFQSCASLSFMDCYCNLLTVQLALRFKWWSCWKRLVYIGCSTFTDV